MKQSAPSQTTSGRNFDEAGAAQSPFFHGSYGARSAPARDEGSVSRQEKLLDEALEESFPASDPPSPMHLY